MAIKKITEVEKASTISDNANVYVEDGSKFLRVSMDTMSTLRIDDDGNFFVLMEEG